MSEPIRHDGLVLSGFALNSWRLLTQYDGLTRDLPPSRRYDATLTLSVFQFLMTNCWDLYKVLSRREGRLMNPVFDFARDLLFQPGVVVIRNPSDDAPVNGQEVIAHLRHAMSHPTVKETTRAVTGYTTVEDGSGLVAKIRFTNSPDVSSKGHLRPGVEGEPTVFMIELPLDRVRALTERVALVLAQPILGNSDSDDLIEPAA
jgi:hypothetical protein